MKIKDFVESSLIAGLRLASTSVSAKLDRELDRLDIGYVDALVLVSLFFEDKNSLVGPARLSKALRLPLPRVSQILTRLQRSGLIRREVFNSDARRFRLVLEPAGIRKAMQIIKAFDATQASIERILGERRAVRINALLLELCQRMDRAER